MNQTSFSSIGQTKPLKCEKFLKEMNQVIPWKKICKKIRPHYESRDTGRTRKPLEQMLRIYCLQQWYNLSDPGVEEAIYDRYSFQKFLGIDLIKEGVPDESTVLHFRHLLEKHQLTREIFNQINAHLHQQGLMMKEGTLVDATLIEAPRSTKNQQAKRDPEMSSTRKNNQWYFGMKAHVGSDADSGCIHSLEITTAKTADRMMLEKLLHGKEKLVVGDKGYYDNHKKLQMEEQGKVQWGVLDRASRNHPLTLQQKLRNKNLAKIRAKIEFAFGVVKSKWNHAKVRYKGLYKNACQFYMLFGLYNLYRLRKKLMGA